MQTSTFGDEFTAVKKAVEGTVMIWYHLRSTGIKVFKPPPIFVENMSLVLNGTNPDSTLKMKTVEFSYYFVREHVANNVVEVRKIHTSNNFADTFTKPLVINDLHGFYHEFIVNG